VAGILSDDDINKIVKPIKNDSKGIADKIIASIKESAKADSEKDEKIITDYVERVRTLQRNYLIMIGLALFFFFLFSFPYFQSKMHCVPSLNLRNN